MPEDISFLDDVTLKISVVLGKTKKTIRDILKFNIGTTIELDKLAGEPVDIYANDRLIAKGEIVVIDEHFGVRITKILSKEELLASIT